VWACFFSKNSTKVERTRAAGHSVSTGADICGAGLGCGLERDEGEVEPKRTRSGKAQRTAEEGEKARVIARSGSSRWHGRRRAAELAQAIRMQVQTLQPFPVESSS
jgi:hypothetical protein